MVETPRCFMRACKHYEGISDAPEEDQRPVCKAFPNGIPHEIAYGKANHLKPYPGDHGIQYEPEK